jgi:hypothetical protein
MKTIYDRTTVTFHRGDAYASGAIDAQPFATFTMNEMADRELIDAIQNLVCEYVHTAHADFCNVKTSTEQWDS